MLGSQEISTWTPGQSIGMQGEKIPLACGLTARWYGVTNMNEALGRNRCGFNRSVGVGLSDDGGRLAV